LVLPPADTALLAELAQSASLIERDPAASAYTEAIKKSAFVRELIEGSLPVEWAATRMVSDDPAKGLGLDTKEAFVPHKLAQIIGEPASEVDLVSPYFVPGPETVDAFVALTERGVKVRVLTNALEATDVAPVHAGYAKRRKALLKGGITLYELRRLSPDRPKHEGSGPFASSGSSLHAKTFSVDRTRAFVGSFNFDPRSAKLNTEMGFVIDSPVLAEGIATAFDSRIPANAYQVHLSDTGKLYWTEHRDGKLVRHDTEPGTSFWKRAGVWFMSLLPIDWLL
jgi:putative cardiolipin synthase